MKRQQSFQNNKPSLYVIATPIGNLSEISSRVLDALNDCEYVFCEDTRVTGQLLAHLNIKKKLVSAYENIEKQSADKVIELLKDNQNVAFMSDAGYPGISDPGYRLVRECAARNVPYEVIPGASAVNVALLMSGLSTSSFTFRGFPPRGPGAIRNWFAEDKDKEHTLICFESPFRVGATLEAAAEVLGDREAAVCIELTKMHERVSRGYLADLAKEFAGAKIKGEVAIVIAGNNPKFMRQS